LGIVGKPVNPVPLPFGAVAAPLEAHPDRSAEMVAGLHRFFDRLTAESVDQRAAHWKRDFSSPEAYEASVAPQRQRLRAMLGAIDPLPEVPEMRYRSGPDRAALVAASQSVRVHEVSWAAFGEVNGEGLLLTPTAPPLARVVVVPDADQTPEMLAGLTSDLPPTERVALRLAEAGCEVLVLALIDRQATWSGNPAIVMTDQTHREWIWRPSFEVGRTLIGLEVRKVEAAIAWFRHQKGLAIPIGVAGYGEGALIALSTAALNPTVSGALVSGYFQAREGLWAEPIYRNVHGLLQVFGDAEIASLVAPRPLIIEPSHGPVLPGPPAVEAPRRRAAAPGRLEPIALDSVRRELKRALALTTSLDGRTLGRIELSSSEAGPIGNFGSTDGCDRFLAALKVAPGKASSSPLTMLRETDPVQRQHRQIEELMHHAEGLMHQSEAARTAFNRREGPGDASRWPVLADPLRERFWRDHVGRLPSPSMPMNPRARFLERGPGYAMWEVVLDVWPEVVAWGTLLVPDTLAAGERRPVVVCQHGLEGLPSSALETNRESQDWRVYRAFPRQLAERGFICYVPHNPYRGGESFRQLQRKANPLGLTLFSAVVGQHQRQLEWLASLPFVDPARIGFYGISYGGLSALRLPALLPGYAVSVCSGAFNIWSSKIMSRNFPNSYVFTREYEQFSFNLANTFSNADLAALIAPRPFMVERGHQDPVGLDEWVAYEYAKVRRLYLDLGVPERTEIEYFAGRHEIHGVGTFAFLHRHLRWPEPATLPR